MERLPSETRTIFAELSERLRALERRRSFASLAGGFAKRRVNGSEYWYFRTSEGVAGQREYFVGPEGQEIHAVMKAYAASRPEIERALSDIARLCAMLRQGGAALTDTPSAKVLSGLANAGLFRLGAVLVGAHAFRAYENVLGVAWKSDPLSKDLAAARRVEVAVPQVKAHLPKALDALNIGFLPAPGLRPKSPQSWFKVRGHTLRVDLLTPAQDADDGKPVFIPRLKAAAQPLELLDYLLEASVATPLINGGATLVHVPDPARFALHKLMLNERRPVAGQAEAGNDRKQAIELIEVLQEDRPGDLRLAANALLTRPAGWRARLRSRVRSLPGGLRRVAQEVERGLRD